MSEKKKSQVIMKVDTTEHWELAEDKYIPAPFTIIVYQDENKAIPRIKISDGTTKLGDLEFINFNNIKNTSVEDEVLQL